MNPSHRIEEMKEVIERYKQRAEAAEVELELGIQLIKRLERQVLEYQAQLAELSKQKPIASTTQCQIELSAEQFIGTMFGPNDMPIKLFTCPVPAKPSKE